LYINCYCSIDWNCCLSHFWVSLSWEVTTAFFLVNVLWIYCLYLNEFRKLNICAMMIICINVLMPVGSYFLHQSLFPLSGVTEALKICCLNLCNSVTAVLSMVECSCCSMLYTFQLGSKHKWGYEWFHFFLFLDTSDWLIYRR